MMVGWAVLVDAPHVFATFSRTYFDREERRARRKLLVWSLLFFLAGPVMVFVGAGFIFFFIAALWAYYHLVKQHYGFMVLYKKKNNDLARVDNALDRGFLLLAFTYPFVAFVARDREAMARVPSALLDISKSRFLPRPSSPPSRGSRARFSAPRRGCRSTRRSICSSRRRFPCTGLCC